MMETNINEKKNGMFEISKITIKIPGYMYNPITFETSLINKKAIGLSLSNKVPYVNSLVPT